MSLSEKYRNFVDKYGLKEYLLGENYTSTSVLTEFIKQYKQFAIWGYDELAKKFMSEFIFELRDLKYIIDENVSNENSGYTIISEAEICKYGIDGIILCCKDGKVKEIAGRLVSINPNVHVLPISSIYNSISHISSDHYYYTINHLQCKIADSENIDVNDMVHLLIEYIDIKDFVLAMKTARAIYRIDKNPVFNVMLNDLKDLYESMLNVAKKKSNNVLLLCFDGLKRMDMPSLFMPKFKYNPVAKRLQIHKRLLCFYVYF